MGNHQAADQLQHSIAAQKAASNTCHAEYFDKLPDAAFVGSSVVLALYGVASLATLWKWQKANRIPAARKVGGSFRNSWNVGELRRALAVKGVQS